MAPISVFVQRHKIKAVFGILIVFFGSLLVLNHPNFAHANSAPPAMPATPVLVETMVETPRGSAQPCVTHKLLKIKEQ